MLINADRTMKRKRRHHFVEGEEVKSASEKQLVENSPGDEQKHSNPEMAAPKQNRPFKKMKPNYTRVQIDPSKKYSTPESRESWGPNVKGKKFRKEKGKKKRCPNAGVVIDGAVKSIRLDA